MEIFNKIRKLDIFWREVILFAVLFVLAVPLVVLIVRRFTFRTVGFNGQTIFRQFDVEEMQEELGESFLEIQEAREDLTEEINKWREFSTTSTSTDDMASTSQE